MRYPLNGSPTVTTKYMQPGLGSLGKHLGIDYGVATGTPVFAPVSGVVRDLKNTSGPGSGGKSIELAGDDGHWHRFLHLSEQMVVVGQRGAEGQQIARSGATGDVTGPHLHWDVRKANTAWNDSLDNYLNPDVLVEEANRPNPQAGGQNAGKTIYLSKTVDKWAFYRPGTPLPLRRVNRAGELSPKKWGGLSYGIVGSPGPNTYEVNSPSLGRIWLYADGDATIK